MTQTYISTAELVEFLRDEAKSALRDGVPLTSEALDQCADRLEEVDAEAEAADILINERTKELAEVVDKVRELGEWFEMLYGPDGEPK